jgi:hypothetical protein
VAVNVFVVKLFKRPRSNQPAGSRRHRIINAKTKSNNEVGQYADYDFVTLRLPLPDAEEETSAAQEPQASEETNEGERGRGPQQGLEEVGGSARGVGLCFC